MLNTLKENKRFEENCFEDNKDEDGEGRRMAWRTKYTKLRCLRSYYPLDVPDTCRLIVIYLLRHAADLYNTYISHFRYTH